MKQLATFIAAIIIVVGGTAAHGYVTGRWRPAGPKTELAMPAIPEVAGQWRGEPMKSGVDDANLRNITRKYTHPRSGRVFTVSLTYGPAGLNAQHTPEYCYTGSGYKEVGQTRSFTASGRTPDTGGFRTAVFKKGSTDALRIFWGWTADGQWSAPAMPELQFMSGTLYKLYIVSWDTERTPEQDAELQEFVGELLKTYQTSLFNSGQLS